MISMEVNQIIEVTVTKVEPGYVKIDYEGHPATLQITELTWKPGKLDSSDYVKVGQKIRVKVIAIAGNEYSVSLKQACLGGTPWDNPPKIGDRYFAPVVFVADYGYFFEITYFCHALLLRENTPDTYQLGDRVNVKVSSVDLNRRKVKLELANEP
ncbi:MAG: S1 RNA-binding domain-containing protein [Oceanicaulis sp.]|nr:S1 RNA-binding domain-containing protein [Oceanicaulis sp.]